MPILFGPDEGLDWPPSPAATTTPRLQEPDWDADADPAWTQQISGIPWDEEGPE